MATETIPAAPAAAQQHAVPPTAAQQSQPVCWPEVLTLEEAAAFLRLRVGTVERLAREQVIPGRYIETSWIFLRRGLEEWLLGKGDRKDSRTRLLQQAGVFADDPHLRQILKDIYKARGRPEVEEGPEG
jgi:hypothetical protein